MATEGAGSAIPKPPKRSIFNKPAWSNPQASGDAVDFFSRSKQSYADIVKEQEDQRKRRIARARRAGSRDDGEDSGHEGKRRRIQEDSEVDDADDESLSGLDDEEDEVTARRKARIIALEDSDDEGSRPPPPPDNRAQSPRSLSRRYEDVVTTSATEKPRQTIPAPIEVSDDDDDDDDDEPVVAALPGRPQPGNGNPIVTGTTQVTSQDPASLSDEEYPELARRARERAKSKRLEATTNGSVSGPLVARQACTETDPLRTCNIRQAPSPPPPDATVHIFITSKIPNTNPLIVQRKLFHSLKDVRMAWCGRQEFDEETTRSVFLTWRGKRLFDVTTCKSLGIGIDKDGNIVLKGEKDSLGEENRQIHMEAMTEEIFEGLRRSRENGTPYGGAQAQIEGQTTKDGPTAAPQNKEEQIRVILKGKGYVDFKLQVRPTTRISKMQNAFRQTRKVDQGSEVFLMFDGERLNPEDTVADTDISDMDHIDVYVK